MKLPYHDRYDYSPLPRRAPYEWPNGGRLALYFALNIENFAFGGPGHFPTSVGHPPDHKNFAWREYGVRVGIWNILDIFEEHGLPLAHLVNSTCYEQYPAIFERIRARSGDEIVGHGRTNSEKQGELPEEGEAALIAEARDVIARHEGRPPAGWMGPWISESHVTSDLLKEAGFRYSMDWPCDDQPIWMRTRSGPLLSVPYPIELNDAPSQLNRHDQPETFCGMIVDQFDEMLRQSRRHPLVMGVSLHTFIMGQPYRLKHLRRAVEYVVANAPEGAVWFTTPGAIAAHVETLPAGVVPGS